MKYDVFISHSSRDRIAVAQILKYLEDNGFKCFVSYRDIPQGSIWADTIVDAIKNSRCVVYVHTEASNVSSHVTREIQLALDAFKRPMLVYRLSDMQFIPSKMYFLQPINWIESMDTPLGNVHILAANISSMLDGLTVMEYAKTYKPVIKEKRNLDMQWLWFAFAFTMLLLVIIIFIYLILAR